MIMSIKLLWQLPPHQPHNQFHALVRLHDQIKDQTSQLLYGRSKKTDSETRYLLKSCFLHKKEKELPTNLHKIGRNLVVGTYKDIANSDFTNVNLKNHLVSLFLKEIDMECVVMCQEKYYDEKEKRKIDRESIFKQTTKEDMLNFSFDKADEEMSVHCPIFRAVLKNAAIRTNKTEESDPFWQTSVVTAAGVCLKNRSQKMSALPLLISTILQHSSYTVS